MQKLHTLCMLPQFLLVHMRYNPFEVENCKFVAGRALWVFVFSNPFGSFTLSFSSSTRFFESWKGEMMEAFHSVVFQCFSFSACCLAVSLSIYSLQLFREAYTLLMTEQGFDPRVSTVTRRSIYFCFLTVIFGIIPDH